MGGARLAMKGERHANGLGQCWRRQYKPARIYCRGAPVGAHLLPRLTVPRGHTHAVLLTSKGLRQGASTHKVLDLLATKGERHVKGLNGLICVLVPGLKALVPVLGLKVCACNADAPNDKSTMRSVIKLPFTN